MFHLLGHHEDDMTYALGWALSRSPRLARRFMELAFGSDAATPTTIKLQESQPGHGRTDVELENDHEHLIIEAKRGWDVPREGQLEQYTPRLADGKAPRIVVLTEATAEHAAAHHLPTDVAGAPVSYVAWRRVADFARDALTASRRPVERAVLSDLHTYVRSFATMRDVTSNLVYVVSWGRRSSVCPGCRSPTSSWSATSTSALSGTAGRRTRRPISASASTAGCSASPTSAATKSSRTCSGRAFPDSPSSKATSSGPVKTAGLWGTGCSTSIPRSLSLTKSARAVTPVTATSPPPWTCSSPATPSCRPLNAPAHASTVPAKRPRLAPAWTPRPRQLRRPVLAR